MTADTWMRLLQYAMVASVVLAGLTLAHVLAQA